MLFSLDIFVSALCPLVPILFGDHKYLESTTDNSLEIEVIIYVEYELSEYIYLGYMYNMYCPLEYEWTETFCIRKHIEV